jgi:alpha-beta hydrolase superfamily lysophospholipase
VEQTGNWKERQITPKMQNIILVLLLLFITITACSAFTTGWFAVDGMNVRVVTQLPLSQKHIGDILYVHGFADRADNHVPLFNKWAQQGFRVIAFDLPSHGDNTGDSLLSNCIDLYTFEKLKNLAVYAYKYATRKDDQQFPLILSGWSTGGLLVTRILQEKQWQQSFSASIVGSILFAPGVSVRTLVGEYGFVTESTLTSNPAPPHLGPIKPTTPLSHPSFAGFLLVNAHTSMKSPITAQIPVLTFIAGKKEDKYVNSAGIKKWANKQKNEYNVDLAVIECPHAKHELDNEIEPINHYVQNAAAEFASHVIVGGTASQWKGLSTPSQFCHIRSL